MSIDHEFGYVKDGKVYVKAYMAFEEREIGVVKESEEASLQYFTERFERAKEKVKEVEEAVSTAQNKGSFLMKIIHMRDYLATYNGIGDFEPLFAALDALEEQIKVYVAENRLKNLEIKQGLLAEAEKLKDSADWEKTADDFKELKMRWIRTGSAPKEEEDAMCKAFDDIIEGFFQRRKRHFDEQRRLTNQRMDGYRDIYYELRRINRSRDKDTDEARARVIELQRKWKEVGKVSKWKYVKIWKKYKHEVDTFFGNASDYQEEDNYAPQKPPTKRELLESVRKIAANNENYFPLAEVKKLQGAWKNLGIVPNDEEDRDLNNRFRTTCNEIFEHSFLVRLSGERFEGFADKTMFEQVKIKIKVLKETIREDENNLNNMPKHDLNAPPRANGQPRLTRDYMNLLNKIKSKKRLLKKLQNQLIEKFY